MTDHPHRFQPLPPRVLSANELIPRQKLFVKELVARHGAPGAQIDAALAAGYGVGTRDGAARAARQLLGNTRIRSALQAELGDRFVLEALAVLATLVDLAEHATSERVRFQAAKEVLDRAFGAVPKRTAVAAEPAPMSAVLALVDRVGGGAKPSKT